MEQDNSSEGPKEFTELDWISLKNDLGTAQMKTVETSSSKFYRKFNENPFVPIGKWRCCSLCKKSITVYT